MSRRGIVALLQCDSNLILWKNICIYENIYCSRFSLCNFFENFWCLSQKLKPFFCLWKGESYTMEDKIKKREATSNVAKRSRAIAGGQTQVSAIEAEQKELNRFFLHWWDEEKARHKVSSERKLFGSLAPSPWQCL